eukprot:scpid61051/ scgid34736/ 
MSVGFPIRAMVAPFSCDIRAVAVPWVPSLIHHVGRPLPPFPMKGARLGDRVTSPFTSDEQSLSLSDATHYGSQNSLNNHFSFDLPNRTRQKTEEDGKHVGKYTAA